MGIGKQRPLIVTKVDAERKKEIELEALNKKLVSDLKINQPQLILEYSVPSISHEYLSHKVP